MIKKFTLTTLCIIAIVAALAGTKILQFRAMAEAGAHMVPPPETVTSAAAKTETWADTIAITGSVAPVQGVTISPQLAGQVVKIDFESGAVVKEGDLLVQLDVSVEEAQLRSAEASAQLAEANLARARDLSQKSTISKSELDVAEAQSKQAAAQVDNIKALVAKKTVRAPFTGRLGLRLVNLGQTIRDGDPISTLQTLDPVYVNFSLPQQRLSDVSTDTMARITTDAAPGQVFEGKITAISPEIDSATRNVRVQATVPNTGEKLRAGMFANVEVMLPHQERVLVVPATAVMYAPYGDSVFVVEHKKNPQTGQDATVLRQQFVRLGRSRGDFVVVENGLKDGDLIVTTGVFKLRPGMPVVVDNTLAPKAQLNPKPDNT